MSKKITHEQARGLVRKAIKNLMLTFKEDEAIEFGHEFLNYITQQEKKDKIIEEQKLKILSLQELTREQDRRIIDNTKEIEQEITENEVIEKVEELEDKLKNLVDLIYKAKLSKFGIAIAIQEIIGEPDEYAEKEYTKAFEEQVKLEQDFEKQRKLLELSLKLNDVWKNRHQYINSVGLIEDLEQQIKELENE